MYIIGLKPAWRGRVDVVDGNFFAQHDAVPHQAHETLPGRARPSIQESMQLVHTYDGDSTPAASHCASKTDDQTPPRPVSGCSAGAHATPAALLSRALGDAVNAPARKHVDHLRKRKTAQCAVFRHLLPTRQGRRASASTSLALGSRSCLVTANGPMLSIGTATITEEITTITAPIMCVSARPSIDSPP